GVIAENADRVAVMYAGKKVEEADVDELFEHPCHPYTKGLFGSIPRLDQTTMGAVARRRLNEIKGNVPSLADLPPGCSFAARCPHASEECRAAEPPLTQKRPGHWAACWHSDRLMAAAP
ncbi:MAG: ABC transporter ATP-binding protein, partial [Alphaproteobacteria bacterium]|nr:ABC transporter ATP-binding protein [Alphaproteobacteria bacterium]